MSAAFQFSGGSEHTTTRAPSAFPTDSGVEGLDTAGRTQIPSRDTRQVPSALFPERGQVPWQVRRAHSETAIVAHQSFLVFRAPFCEVNKTTGAFQDVGKVIHAGGNRVRCGS
jgi:hypothetical protein